MSGFLLAVGILILLGAGIAFILAAFNESSGWGFAVMFIPFASLVFLSKFWERVRKIFFVRLAGGAVLLLGVLIAPTQTPAAKAQEARPTPPPASLQTTPAALLVSVEPEPTRVPHPARFSNEPREEEKRPVLEQVYAVNETGQFYTADCAKRPSAAYRVAKAIAVRQGFTEAPCAN